MRLYAMLQGISKELTPRTDSFFSYLVHTLDDDIKLLHTGPIYRQDPLPDRDIVNKLYLCINSLINDESEFYDVANLGTKDTIITPKIRTLLILSRDVLHECQQHAWSFLQNYPYIYAIDFTHAFQFHNYNIA